MEIEHDKDWNMYLYLKLQYKNINMFFNLISNNYYPREFKKTIAPSG